MYVISSTHLYPGNIEFILYIHVGRDTFFYGGEVFVLICKAAVL